MKLLYEGDSWVIKSWIGKEPLYRFCRMRRQNAGRTVAGLEEELGMSHGTLSHIEDGSTKSIDKMLRMLQALGYEVYIRPIGQAGKGQEDVAPKNG